MVIFRSEEHTFSEIVRGMIPSPEDCVPGLPNVFLSNLVAGYQSRVGNASENIGAICMPLPYIACTCLKSPDGVFHMSRVNVFLR